MQAQYEKEATPLNNIPPKKVKTAELFSEIPEFLRELFDSSEYPWQIIKKIPDAIEKIAALGGFSEISEGIFIGRDVKISETATLNPPLLICDGTEIRPGAYLRGGVIAGRGCVIGNSSEIKNSVLLDGVQIPHYNYVGESVIGYRAHLGAGSICSNLKSGGGDVTVHGDEDIPTGMRKLGAILADGADIGSGCVLNPGTVVGKGTSVYPLTPLRGVYPAGCIVKSQSEIVKKI